MRVFRSSELRPTKAGGVDVDFGVGIGVKSRAEKKEMIS